jgi:hypothetical protein
MIPHNVHDFFITSGGAAGALTGLLFVAISLSAARLQQQTADAQLHRIGASASLTAFTNVLPAGRCDSGTNDFDAPGETGGCALHDRHGTVPW